MEDTFQVLRVRMFLDRPMEKPAINQVLEPSTEALTSQLTLNTNHYSRLSSSNTLKNNTKQQLKLLEFRDNKIHIRR